MYDFPEVLAIIQQYYDMHRMNNYRSEDIPPYTITKKQAAELHSWHVHSCRFVKPLALVNDEPITIYGVRIRVED